MKEKPIKVLVIESDLGFTRQLKELFIEAEKEHGQRFDLEYVEELYLGLERLAKGGIDIILLDLSLPDSVGLEALSRIYAHAKNVTIVALLDKDKNGLTEGALLNGATDCLLKDELNSNLLVHSINLSLKQHRLYLLLIQAKKEIEIGEAQFREVIEKYLVTIIILDMRKIVRFVNSVAESLYGRSKEDLLNKKFDFPIVLNKIVEIHITRKSGKIAIAQMYAVVITWQGEDAYLIMLQDITERKHIDEIKDKFIGTVSHELRTPLAIIKEGVSLVLDGSVGPIKEEQAKYLGMVKANIDRLALLVNDLLDISKLKSGKIKLNRVLIDFSTMLQETCAKWKIETDKNCQSLEYCPPDLPVNIYLDPDKLTQILDNLIFNAIKFTPKQGKIKVELTNEKNQIEISVSDNGIGIAKEDLPKVFSRFQQFNRPQGGAGYKGTGLGLAIVKELIELLKGGIKVESELNKGTKFILTIPKIAEEEMFKEYVANGIKEAADRNSPLSLAVMHITEFSQLQEKFGKKPLYLLTDIERRIKDCLCRQTDMILRATGELVIIMPNTGKQGAEVARKRIKEAVKAYISQSKENWIKEIRITLGTATFPDEANNHQELLNKARIPN
ncbi:MAG: ATP-binding protein [Candidatus Omnitrophota bacterium]|nr:ATP-binding protein [Candidatus Omnitrophota bacterium]